MLIFNPLRSANKLEIELMRTEIRKFQHDTACTVTISSNVGSINAHKVEH